MALAAVVAVQLILGAALLIGLRVDFARQVDLVQRLVQVTLEKPPPPVEPVEMSSRCGTGRCFRTEGRTDQAGRVAWPIAKANTPIRHAGRCRRPTAAPSGGGTGTGIASGSGSGGGAGGTGAGGGGGRDLELLSGEILPGDYPRRLARAGIGGTVQMRCTVLATGRVSRCIVTRSSGVPELDAITPRLIEQRFVYRPATDRSGRPVTDDIDVDWTWD